MYACQSPPPCTHPLSRRALAKARAAAGLAPRQRGGQPGNRNRLKHGRYSEAFKARRRHTAALLQTTRALLDELHALLAARRIVTTIRTRIVRTTAPFRAGLGKFLQDALAPSALRWRPRPPKVMRC